MDLLVCGCKVTKCDCEWIANGFAKRKPRTTFAVIVRLLMSAGFCIVASGCDGLFVKPSNPDNPVPIVVERVNAADVWESLATAVDKQTIRKSDVLAQVVLVLSLNADLDADAVAKFDAKFPKAGKPSRQLSADDSASLRSLK